MSRHDYTQHSKKIQNEVNEVDKELATENIEPSEEGKIEVVAESKPSEEGKIEEVETEIETKVEVPRPAKTESYDLGVVSGCSRLRVRSEPCFGINVICEIDQGTRVMIDRSKSTFDYYKIYTEAGVEGFCLKTYIV